MAIGYKIKLKIKRIKGWNFQREKKKKKWNKKIKTLKAKLVTNANKKITGGKS